MSARTVDELLKNGTREQIAEAGDQLAAGRIRVTPRGAENHILLLLGARCERLVMVEAVDARDNRAMSVIGYQLSDPNSEVPQQPVYCLE